MLAPMLALGTWETLGSGRHSRKSASMLVKVVSLEGFDDERSEAPPTT
jgi:hypothetical protein